MPVAIREEDSGADYWYFTHAYHGNG
jgi:hypothetical protein